MTTDQAVMILSDSLLPPIFAGSQDDTLVPYSPSQMLNTDVSQGTLKSLDNHDQAAQQQVQGACKTNEMFKFWSQFFAHTSFYQYTTIQFRYCVSQKLEVFHAHRWRALEAME